MRLIACAGRARSWTWKGCPLSNRSTGGAGGEIALYVPLVCVKPTFIACDPVIYESEPICWYHLPGASVPELEVPATHLPVESSMVGQARGSGPGSEAQAFMKLLGMN